MEQNVFVLIPGITGSVLEKNGKTIWGPSAGFVLGMLTGAGIKDLVLGEDNPDDEQGDGTTATRVFPDVHLFPGLWKIDGYTKVAERLQQNLELEKGANYFEFPYDWRRDNRLAARRLQRASATWLARRREKFPGAKLVLLAHSMGGLVARYFLEVLDGWRDTAALITFGTPYRGSLDALDSLANGVHKLLRAVDLTAAVRSFTSTYQLLPIYQCYDAGTGALVHLKEVDQIPGLVHDRVVAADGFHREIENAVKEHRGDAAYTGDRYAIHPCIGLEQPTAQTARVSGSRVELISSRGGKDESGDGTVPRVSASPIEEGEGHAIYAATRHASLQNADAVLTHVQGVLTQVADLDRLRARPPVAVSLDLEDVFLAGEPISISAAASEPGENLTLTVEDAESNRQVATAKLPRSDAKWRHAELPPLPSGIYRAIVSGALSRVLPVSDVFVVAQ